MIIERIEFLVEARNKTRKTHVQLHQEISQGGLEGRDILIKLKELEHEGLDLGTMGR